MSKGRKDIAVSSPQKKSKKKTNYEKKNSVTLGN